MKKRIISRKEKSTSPRPKRQVPGIGRDAELEEEARLAGWQDQIGNRAAQQLLAQRQEAARAGFNPLDPAAVRAALREGMAREEAPVWHWLDEHLSSLRLLALTDIVARLKQEVPEAARLSDEELQNMAQTSARRQGFGLLSRPVLEPSGPRPTLTIPDAVKRAFSIATDPVEVISLPNGRVNISVSGLTTHLGGGQLDLNWKEKSIGLEIPVKGFHLGGRLAQDSWELTLSIPGASSVPDLNQLSEVFEQAETALHGIVQAAAQLQDLDDVSAVYAAVSPHIGPVKTAVETLRNLAAMPRFQAEIRASGPLSSGEAVSPTEERTKNEVRIMATVTFRFE